MTNAQLIWFIVIISSFFLIIVLVAAVVFARWAKNDRVTMRREKEIEIAMAMRDRKARYPTEEE
ncbi:MAG TPA: hypothetical protein VG944_14470 [Fimbriimonas sp.]|nr:hypothetical protein [Fimbriimonas sp.]